jgi:hypothetical protein
MATPVAQVVKVNWKLVFPWLALFRALGLALHVRQIFVGVIAVLLIAAGEHFIGGIPLPQSLPGMPFDSSLVSWVLLPWVDVIYPLLPPGMFSNSLILLNRLRPDWGDTVRILIRFVWGLVIGGLAGGILVRRAGMEFAKEESVGLLSTTRFVLKRSLDYLSAPALPLGAVAALWVSLWLMGFVVALVPGSAYGGATAGHYLLSAVWGLVLAVGIVMAILLIAVFLGWPMMIAAVSINGGDGFDGLSRGFGFVLDRWRYYAWCVALMTVYGALSLCLVLVVLSSGEYLSISALKSGIGGWNPHGLPRVLPEFAWPFFESILVRGFAYSFFWSSMAIIYLVLRQSVDNAELHDIYVEGSPQDSESLQSLINPSQPEAPPPTLLPIINQP